MFGHIIHINVGEVYIIELHTDVYKRQVLHAQIAMMKGFQEMEVLDGSSLEEDEANFFAAELLLSLIHI